MNIKSSLLAYADRFYIRRFPQKEERERKANEQTEVDQIEAGLNKLRVRDLRAKVERQAKEITRLERSRTGLKKHNKELREEQGQTHIKVDFSGPAYETLNSLAKARGKTKAAIIHEALAFEVWLQEIQESGGRILVERDGKAREIVWL